MTDKKKKEIKWIDGEGNPWGVPVLDLRPEVSQLTSYSRYKIQAENAISFGGDEGFSFIDQKPEFERKINTSISYPIDKILLDGVLYTPNIMEDKWAVFYHNKNVIFVKSWLREVKVVGKVEIRDEILRVFEINGVFTSEDESSKDTELYFDFLIRNLAYNKVYPVPISEELAENPDFVVSWCFGHFGKIALVATHHNIPEIKIEQPLRTNSVFHIAIAKEDIRMVKKFINKGVSLDILAKDGYTPLHWALSVKNYDIVNLLLEKGVDINNRSISGNTPLMSAVEKKDLKKVKFLIDNGSDVNAQDNRGFTSLHRSAQMGSKDITILLLGNGANSDITADDHTAMSLAKKYKQNEIIKILEDL